MNSIKFLLIIIFTLIALIIFVHYKIAVTLEISKHINEKFLYVIIIPLFFSILPLVMFWQNGSIWIEPISVHSNGSELENLEAWRISLDNLIFIIAFMAIGFGPIDYIHLFYLK